MTNKIVLREVSEFIAGYTPQYAPIYGMFASRGQSYSEEVGNLEFKRIEAMGDIRAKRLNPKDTVIAQLSAREKSKAFKKYFFANQFTVSALQDQQGVEDVVGQVLDEHNKQFDELLLFGEGTSASNMVNNGLYWSDDANYVLHGSGSEATVSSVATLHTEVMKTVAEAQLPGDKLIMFYGEDTLAYVDSLHADFPTPFKKTLLETLGGGYSIAKLPASVTPASAEGWIVITPGATKLHYSALPKIQSQGVNEEKMYVWTNFLMGSCMLDVTSPGGVIRQDATVS